MSLADTLIQTAWAEATGNSVKLWNGVIPEEEQAKYPNAGYVFTGYSDDESPLSGARLETESYSVSIAHTDRRKVWEIARRLKTAFDELDHESLANATGKIADFAIPVERSGKPLWYELNVDVSLSLWDQEE